MPIQPGDVINLLYWTLAILSRQEGRMSLTIDELSPKFMLTKETCHATPARRHHTGLSAVRTTLFRPCLAPCASVTPGGDPDAWGPHGDCGLAGDGAGDGGPLHERPSGPESGHLVGPPGESDSVRLADCAAGPPRSDDGLRG